MLAPIGKVKAELAVMCPLWCRSKVRELVADGVGFNVGADLGMDFERLPQLLA